MVCAMLEWQAWGCVGISEPLIADVWHLDQLLLQMNACHTLESTAICCPNRSNPC
jgi:hypothetical protein